MSNCYYVITRSLKGEFLIYVHVIYVVDYVCTCRAMESYNNESCRFALGSQQHLECSRSTAGGVMQPATLN